MSEKKAAINEFSKGLNMDLNPISQPNNSLSDCLNGTIITYDGNEFNLQNDFGNYSLKNCSLQQGFVPVGMKSYGDIIYIASCSKDGKLCELGTYPSPKYPKLDELDYSTNNQAYAENLELENNYKPLWNYSVNGTRQNFTTGLLNFDLDHPVNIEIQPSYDGSVNLILNDDKNEPRLINSGFSIYENRKARLVKRNQKEATNLYLEEKFKNQIRLKKVVEKISRFELLDVPSTGQLKGGNYTFYLKMADGDYNKSDIVAESGQISIFKGNSTSINSIHGTLLNETTDKAIQLRIDNIDTSFSNFYILYSREFSDLNGVRQYETYELTKQMLEEYPQIEGIYVSWDAPAKYVLNALTDMGREDVIVSTGDLEYNIALNLAKGGMVKSISAQMPYEQGEAVATVAVKALLDEVVPSYIGVEPVYVDRYNLQKVWQKSYKEPLPEEIKQALNWTCLNEI